MKKFLIGYDLNKAGQDYTTLIQKIKELGPWCHCLDSTWIIKSNLTAANLQGHLSQFIDSNDEILVVGLSGEAAWTLTEVCSNWLKENL